MKSHLMGDVNWNLIQGTEQGRVTEWLRVSDIFGKKKFRNIFRKSKYKIGCLWFCSLGRVRFKNFAKNIFFLQKIQDFEFFPNLNFTDLKSFCSFRQKR